MDIVSDHQREPIALFSGTFSRVRPLWSMEQFFVLYNGISVSKTIVGIFGVAQYFRSFPDEEEEPQQAPCQARCMED